MHTFIVHIYDHSFSWLDTGTSIKKKCGGVKLELWVFHSRVINTVGIIGERTNKTLL